MNFQGDFETHITVDSELKQWENLSNWCRARGLKCVHIVLDRGLSSSQPMLTRHGFGTLQSEMREANALCYELQTVGFKVSRIKLEVAISNRDVPRNQDDVKRTNGCYFEHHVKLLLPKDADVESIKQDVEKHGAHLSRNARRTRTDGKERFVTQRCKDVGREEAQIAFQLLLQTIEKFSFPILETEAEYVVFDSNLALDAGWIDDITSDP